MLSILKKGLIMLYREDGYKSELGLKDLLSSYNEWPECEMSAFSLLPFNLIDSLVILSISTSTPCLSGFRALRKRRNVFPPVTISAST